MKLAPTNPMRSALASVLIFDIVVFWLAFLGVINLEETSLSVALAVTVAASLLALLASAGLRQGWGYYLGWVTQVVGILLGLVTPWMYAMGIIFALIWVMSFVLGKRLEHRSERTS